MSLGMLKAELDKMGSLLEKYERQWSEDEKNSTLKDIVEYYREEVGELRATYLRKLETYESDVLATRKELLSWRAEADEVREQAPPCKATKKSKKR